MSERKAIEADWVQKLIEVSNCITHSHTRVHLPFPFIAFFKNHFRTEQTIFSSKGFGILFKILWITKYKVPHIELTITHNIITAIIDLFHSEDKIYPLFILFPYVFLNH